MPLLIHGMIANHDPDDARAIVFGRQAAIVAASRIAYFIHGVDELDNYTGYLRNCLPWQFCKTKPENAISRFLHFQRITAVENGGSSLNRSALAILQKPHRICFPSRDQHPRPATRKNYQSPRSSGATYYRPYAKIPRRPPEFELAYRRFENHSLIVARKCGAPNAAPPGYRSHGSRPVNEIAAALHPLVRHARVPMTFQESIAVTGAE